jgi:uncharacterized protein YjbI with pentapeptide repeats
MRQPLEPTKILQRAGHGRPPKEIGHTQEGLLDLRGLRLPSVRKTGFLKAGGPEYAYSRSKPIFKGLDLRDIDLTGASLDDSYWADCTLQHVKLDDASCNGTNFDASNMDSISFVRTNLRDAHWGIRGVDGPIISKCDFVQADLRGSTYGHPLFRDCRFVNCNLKDVKFRGGRFERCTFVGLLDGVWFKGWQKDDDPKTAGLRNSMEGVDFSQADLRFVGFTHGIDLTRSKLPSEGYIRIPHPRETYAKALERVRGILAGKAREAAEFYLNGLIKGHFNEDQPFDVFRPEDLLESPMGRKAAMVILQAIREVLAANPT